MDEKYWKQFEASGKIEDYLHFAAVREAEKRKQSAKERDEEDRSAACVRSGILKDSGETGQACRNIFM